MCKGKQQVKFWKLPLIATALVLSTSANAALIERLGGLAYYDDVADLTWLADANLAASNTFGLQTGVNLGSHPLDSRNNGYSVINANGTMNWIGALHWIDAMNTSNHLGFNNWRLAETAQPDTTCSAQNGTSFGYGCSNSEMGNLYNVEGITLATPGIFSNFQSGGYWSGTEFAPFVDNAWFLDFGNGYQGATNKGTGYYALAVRSGDVSAVPVPAAVWLFGSGLVGLVGLARRKKA